jgi:hypothetical protein
MEKVEYEFPDPDKDENAKRKTGFAEDDDNFEIQIVDDTPPQDRGRKAGDPPEEVSEEELGQYSEKVKKRIQHFTKGYHDERRAKESALREREEAVRLTEKIVHENKKLREQMSQSQEALLEQAKQSAEMALETSKRAYKEAYESGDADAVSTAQEALITAKMKAERVNNFRLNTLQSDEDTVKSNTITTPDAPVDVKAQSWQRKNSWFGDDDEMTSFALGLHTKLVKQGIDPKGDEYYEKIDARMRQVFPDQFDEEQESVSKPRQKANVVAPATRSTAPKKIVLTQTQVALAKRLGVPLEIYARQVAEDMRKQNG